MVWHYRLECNASKTAQQEYMPVCFDRLEGEKKFVSVAVVSDVLVALCKPCVTASLQVLLPAQQIV